MKLRARLVALNLIDAVLLNVAVLAALALRFEGVTDDVVRFGTQTLRFAPIYTIALLAVMNLSGVNQSLWRYAGLPTFLTIVRNLFLAFFLLFFVNLIPSPQLLPKSVVILSWLIATVLIVASRVAWKIVRSPLRRAHGRGRRILIAGAGDVGVVLATELQRRLEEVTPIGFVDDDPAKQGRRVEYLPVLGTTVDLPRIITERRIDEVLIAAPSAPARLVRQIVSYCQEAGVDCKTVPALSDYVVGKGALGQVRQVQIEDLLGRDPVSIDTHGILEKIRGRTVLVTGAAGSIGSELCRQLARFEPGLLVALDHAENPLTYLGLELAEQHPRLNAVYAIGDVKDEFGIDAIFRTHRPDLVFHAAAHKHVNMMERAPREAILNNISGTRNVARSAVTHGVQTFVLISTDKAVNPSSVMGASKRGCEMLLQAMSRATEQKTAFVAVRFGNVLGSEGSVLPIFRRQLAAGGPLTVTHPEVRRYFMTIPEASQLVLQAGLFGASGTVYVLDMGEPVRIFDVAEQLIRLSGLRPGVDISIKFVGLRPGEKLNEELLTASERTRITKHSRIFQWELDAVDGAKVEKEVEQLIRLAHHASPQELKEALGKLVPEYQQVELPSIAAASGERIQPVPAPAPERLMVRPDPFAKRAFDVVVSATLLLVLTPLAGIALLLHKVSGPARVRFVREERIGRNRRREHRRRPEDAAVRIDRRGRDRRVRPLPGPIFVCYRIEVMTAPQNRTQRAISRLLIRYRLDRLLYLWNVLRGHMSLVGPASRLLEEATFTEDWTTAYIFARRPGLVGPGRMFAGDDEVGARLATLYDGYYSKFGGVTIDLETLLRTVPLLIKGETTARAPEGEKAKQPGGNL